MLLTQEPSGISQTDYETLFKIFIPMLLLIIVILLFIIFHLAYNLKYNYTKKEITKSIENKQN